MTPLEMDEIPSQDKALDLPGPLDGKQASFLAIDDPNLALTRGSPPKMATAPSCAFSTWAAPPAQSPSKRRCCRCNRPGRQTLWKETSRS